MKLLFCPTCDDVVKLQMDKTTTCACGDSFGRYLEDGLHAEYGGKAILLGIDNRSFVKTWMDQTNHGDATNGMGREFTAFFLPEKCSTTKKVS